MGLIPPSESGIKYAAVSAEADGVNNVIAAVTGAKIVVIGYVLTADAAGEITVQDTTGTPVVMAVLDFAQNSSVSYAGGIGCPAFETSVGEGLDLNNAASVDVHGHIAYIEV